MAARGCLDRCQLDVRQIRIAPGRQRAARRRGVASDLPGEAEKPSDPFRVRGTRWPAPRAGPPAARVDGCCRRRARASRRSCCAAGSGRGLSQGVGTHLDAFVIVSRGLLPPVSRSAPSSKPAAIQPQRHLSRARLFPLPRRFMDQGLSSEAETASLASGGNLACGVEPIRSS